MKAFNFVILSAIVLLLSWSCQNSTEADTTTDELIFSNLSKNGKTDPELLIGEWDVIKFAYTKDGNEISNETAISKGRLIIPCAPTPEHCDDDLWKLVISNAYWIICSLSDNLIELKFTKQTMLYDPSEQIEIVYALAKACSFIVKDDELVFYFKGEEDKNLLILKKEKS